MVSVKNPKSTVKPRKNRGSFVKNKRGYVWKAGSEGKGKHSQDSVTQALNAYRKEGGAREILDVNTSSRPSRYRVYDSSGGFSQRAVASTGRLHGIKFKDISERKERVGWITDEGQVVGEDEVIRAIKGLDEAAGVTMFDDNSLLRVFLEAGPKTRAKMAEQFITNVKWDDLFKEIYVPKKLGKGRNAKTVKMKATDETIQARHQQVWSLIAEA